jgi:hypothetical protein
MIWTATAVTTGELARDKAPGGTHRYFAASPPGVSLLTHEPSRAHPPRGERSPMPLLHCEAVSACSGWTCPGLGQVQCATTAFQ